MAYKFYNELPGVGTTAKNLISVIYYNVYNMMEWRHQTGAKGERVTLHTWQHRGTPGRRKWHGGNTPHVAV